MPRAVRFDHYGGVDVLKVVEVQRPVPGHGEALVRVKAAGINPGESSIREGRMHERFPATFPPGQGSDLAGVVEEVADDIEQFASRMLRDHRHAYRSPRRIGCVSPRMFSTAWRFNSSASRR
jgi:NADPH:quinone reductase-like Zn-dependent oxidoreductase